MPSSPLNNALLTVAPNGARKMKSDHPALPLLPDDIAFEAEKCRQAGAQMIHLHVRDDDGKHSLDPARYRAAIDAIKRLSGDALLIQITSEACGVYRPDQQIEAVLSVKPQAVSIAIRELLPDDSWLTKSGDFFHELNAVSCAPQYILYTPEEVHRFATLQREGVIPLNHRSVLCVLGRYSTSGLSTPSDLMPFYQAMELEGMLPDYTWSVCAFGPYELSCVLTAIALGGHGRIGFENNMKIPNGALAKDNAELIGNAARLIRAQGRSLASLSEAKSLFGIA